MRILLADHHSEVRSALRLLLNQEQWVEQVGEAADAEALLARVASSCPDMVLVEWELLAPDADRLLSEIRSICNGSLVVALSGRPEARSAALEAGVDAFLSKSDPPDRVLSTLRSAITRVPN